MRSSHGLHAPAYPANRGLFSRRWPRARHRAPRSRTGTAVVLLAVGLVLVLSGPAGPTAAAFAANDQPTVSFIGDGPAPLSCSSVPTPANLTVKQNTRVVLANFTGADATVTIGDGQTVAVAGDKAISVKLKVGSYTITMTPDCLETHNVVAIVVTVVTVAPPPPSPVPSPPARSDAGGALSSGPAVGASTAGTGGSSSLSPAGTPVVGGPASGAGVADPAEADTSGPDVQEAAAVRPDNRPDGRGNRLLAVIAAICVFGVTSAIIRAIVAQRATGAVGT